MTGIATIVHLFHTDTTHKTFTWSTLRPILHQFQNGSFQMRLQRCQILTGKLQLRNPRTGLRSLQCPSPTTRIPTMRSRNTPHTHTLQIRPTKQPIQRNRIKVLFQRCVVQFTEFFLHLLRGEEFLACGKVVLRNGGAEVAFGLGSIAVAKDETEGVGRAEAPFGCVLLEDCDAYLVPVAVCGDHSDHVQRHLIPSLGILI
mmetsp:Transcript_20899/g.30607  ORF Transcript_20899/g.30607 Transcript_20899/m.30607 type:complete len:201 (-) Transcript_20899:269-871(-)